MSALLRGGHRLAFTDEGVRDGVAVVFCHSLGLDSASWDLERDRLGDRFRIVRIDFRGHGRSGAPEPPYRVADLAGDVLAVADHLGIERFHVVGVSLGGLTALWMAINRRHRLLSATLANTGARLGDEAIWNARIAAVRQGGMASIVDGVIPRFFAPGFAEREPATYAWARDRLLRCDPDGYIGCCCALRDEDLRAELGAVRIPVLIVGSRRDAASPVGLAEALHAGIGGSELLVLDTPGHVSNLEDPASFGAGLEAFLCGQP